MKPSKEEGVPQNLIMEELVNITKEGISRLTPESRRRFYWMISFGLGYCRYCGKDISEGSCYCPD